MNAVVSETLSSCIPEKQAVLWQAVQDELKTCMPLPGFETWISPLVLSEISNGTVYLQTDSEFNRDLILKRYRSLIEDAFKNHLNQPVALQISVEAGPSEETTLEAHLNDALYSEPLPNRPWTPRVTKSNLNPKHTFEAFVVGQHNKFCHAAALAIAETPGENYNPFFIYGGVGLGKTHLMQAIGHYVLKHTPDLTVRYVTAEEFTNDMIAALGRKDMKGFQSRYRKNDVLVIDDVQFLEGKTRTQEEVFHTFNALYSAGKQIILSSDRSPSLLSRLEDRLRSRFSGGLIADIQSPDLETRVAILRQKAEREALQVSDEICTQIAELYPSNIRELEGALNKVAAYAMLTKTPVTPIMAQTILGTPVDKARISLEDILDTVAGYYRLQALDLKSPSRAKDLSHARQVAIYIVRELTETSFPKIGQLLGNRKHTTILYAYEKIKEEIESRPALKQQVTEIKARLH
ncbi:MAG: chromosomal replication initiator protein DnaA [Cyanobacteria bacterium P01_H01_bin.74]